MAKININSLDVDNYEDSSLNREGMRKTAQTKSDFYKRDVRKGYQPITEKQLKDKMIAKRRREREKEDKHLCDLYQKVCDIALEASVEDEEFCK